MVELSGTDLVRRSWLALSPQTAISPVYPFNQRLIGNQADANPVISLPSLGSDTQLLRKSDKEPFVFVTLCFPDNGAMQRAI